MARDGGGTYSLPAGFPSNGDPSDVSQIVTPFEDLETDMNTPRPIVAGGTGASTAKTARSGLLFAKGSDVASAAALALGTDGNYFDVTGTNAITSIGTWNVGDIAFLQFDDALTLTHHATDLILPGGANITTAAGDQAAFIEYAAGNWRCLWYTYAGDQTFYTGGSSRMDINDSGVRLGAANARVTTILDEDTMATDSATALATQQSIKAYVDNIDNGVTGKTWTDVSGSRGYATDYQNTSGAPLYVMVVSEEAASATTYVTVKIGSTTSPTLVCGRSGVYGNAAGAWRGFLSFVVPESHYYRVERTGGTQTIEAWVELE